MCMQGERRGGVVHVGGNARERYYDSRGYGRPADDGELDLAPVEAAHLLYRGDLDAVDGRGFRGFLAENEELTVPFLVYKDLRDRGFYLSPAREGWVREPAGVDLVVFPRGSGPWDEAVEYRIRVVGERADVPAATLGDAVLAVVDEESEITYLDTATPDVEGSSEYALPSDVAADLLGDRVVCWEPPSHLYERGFYGQPLDGEQALQLSLVEAAHLADAGALALEVDRVVARGREVEGDRFDRRLAAYADLRSREMVPKTGFKFGADFRTYADVDSVEDLGHSELLVRVLPADHVFAPRDLALDVRMAGGVRKRMVFALTDASENIHWLAVERLTP